MIVHRAIGSSRPRADAKVFVEGRGCYLDDVQVGKVLHVAFLRSPHAKAAIKFIRTEGCCPQPRVLSASIRQRI